MQKSEGVVYPAKIGVLAIMKNEALNLWEWIDHYFWIDAHRIYLIDNGSTDNSTDIARTHPRATNISLIELPEKHHQIPHYRTAFENFRIKDECEWLMIADLDEFWFCKSGQKITEILKDYKGIDVIYANWSVFGSNKCETHPDSIRRELIYRRRALGSHLSTKWICRTSAIHRLDQIYTHKVHRVDSSRTISDNIKFQINHYVTQSKHYFQNVKMLRGDASNPINDRMRDWVYFERYDKDCIVKDTALRDLLDSDRPG